jgi:hypothetical protein
MITKPTRILIAALSAIGLLAGCSTTTTNTAGLGTDNGRVGSNPGGISPQQVYTPPEFKKIVWWNVGSFEAVPENLAAAGQEFCGCMDTDTVEYKATGYHPYARQVNSVPFAGGGFYCEARNKPVQTAAAEPAPAEKAPAN